MNKKKFRTKMRLLIVLTLLLLALTGFAVGKYKNTIPAGGGNVTFTAELAESMTLLEHEAVRQRDGTYELNMNKTVTSNTYVLMPGVDIPKDPHITITGRTAIPACLFIEVKSTLDENLQDFEIDTTKWTYLLTTSDSKKVYYYNGTVTDGTIYILKNKPTTGRQVQISQNLLLQGDTETDVLEIHALLKEKVGLNDEKATYNY